MVDVVDVVVTGTVDVVVVGVVDVVVVDVVDVDVTGTVDVVDVGVVVVVVVGVVVVVVVVASGTDTVTDAFAVAVTGAPMAGVPVTVATFVNDALSASVVHGYVTDAPAVRVPITRAHEPVSGSTTVTLVSVESPLLSTVIENVTKPPEATVGVAAVFVMEIAGSMTATASVSSADTGAPTAGWPVTDAVLSIAAFTVVSHVEVSIAPGARISITLAHAGTSGSPMVTLVSGTSPVFVTVRVNVTVDPLRTTGVEVDLTIEIDGCTTL